ncbi:Phospholipase D beta 2 [Camellia lanceoleosa]|uniref:Phospholipase D beta 2 n=1 Tax=Camellia lanceoleosa TaxID=1840588 RepID=A0ACC0F1Y7_9ERIC|nr:Phospholipase D beta 2 [Camellia lanceoleosa]
MLGLPYRYTDMLELPFRFYGQFYGLFWIVLFGMLLPVATVAMGCSVLVCFCWNINGCYWLDSAASLAGTEVSVDKIRSATASSDRYYPSSLYTPLISSPEPDPNGANNLIPMEIALKIVEKIRARERFAAYIIISIWPEGNPTGAATQKILFCR